jgi:hypothetical protein
MTTHGVTGDVCRGDPGRRRRSYGQRHEGEYANIAQYANIV